MANHSVRMACPVETDGDPCEADLVLWVGGTNRDEAFIDMIEPTCSHVLTVEQEEFLLEQALEELAYRAEDR